MGSAVASKNKSAIFHRIDFTRESIDHLSRLEDMLEIVPSFIKGGLPSRREKRSSTGPGDRGFCDLPWQFLINETGAQRRVCESRSQRTSDFQRQLTWDFLFAATSDFLPASYLGLPTRNASQVRNEETERKVIELSLAGTVSQKTVALFVRLSIHKRL
jgi:hypothetical protein